MEKLRHFRESNIDSEFNGYNECEKIVLNNMKENFSDLCLSIQQFLDTDKQRYISQFSMAKLCFRLTQIMNEEFLFNHFQNIVLPSIINYIYNNQMYSKELEPKAQQFIQSSVILCKELLSFWAHVYPQTPDFSTSKFLSEYQIFKKQQKENKIDKTKKSQYIYIKEQFKIHLVYKAIKDKWKRQNLVSEFNISDEERSPQLSSRDNLNPPLQDQNKEQLQQELDDLIKQINEKKKELDQKKKELEDVEINIQKKTEEFQHLPNSISNQSKSTEAEQFRSSGTSNSSIYNKQIFDSTFNFDDEKFPIKKQFEDIPLVSIDTSYPQKKRRLLDGRGVFHVHENFLLARQQILNENTMDLVIYLKCIENPMKDLLFQVLCQGKLQKQNTLGGDKQNLLPGEQIKFEIRDIDKSLLIDNDIEIKLNIDWKQSFPETICFYLKLTNIVSYNYAIEADLVKEYQNIPKVLISKEFIFDSEVFPNGLEDIQKCIQYSINYKQKNQLLFSGSLNNNAFICRITLNQEGQAQVIIKKLQNEELAKRLIIAYIEALQKID
ncbi:unnamed protein product [Paramecium octaurelia]|uniref:Uncharacterized protein n=1 Tax=Paramecium octaurelia TaxID=43137 RepID=A0A8S1WQ30_PAROT|nr:unnamed protein product [Paramecium octaurelia]